MLPSIRIDVAIIGAGTAGLYLPPRWKRKVTLSIVFSDPNEVSVGARPGELNQERIFGRKRLLVLSLVVAVVVLVTGIAAMISHGLQPQATLGLLMLIPILTLLGIEWLRLQHSLSYHFTGGAGSGTVFIILTAIFMQQLGVMLLDYRVMQLHGYLRRHLSGRARSGSG
ncbi:hypothetical protein [Pseudomonas sp. GD03696]|uniref:hypothetical protein n=1 Tax=Pseudomonas sp. GD03696 TaxID=2975368 RepID=UPI00244C3379|nr:hypothetical protein [Pseudomonas sp. GD03696]MDH1932731.1 hypothetical protein [Pseudomonas sp. GD03696]